MEGKMKSLLKNELYRAIVNKKMLCVLTIESIIVLLYVIYNVIPVITDTIPFLQSEAAAGKVDYIPGAIYTWLPLRHNSFKSMLNAIIPVLAAIPYGATLFLDENEHYVYHVKTRNNKAKYYIAKLCGFFTSGGIVAMFPFLLSFLISIALLPIEKVLPSFGIGLGSISLFSDAFYTNTIVYIIIYLLYTFICFGIWNCLCFCGSYLFDNRFVVLLFPFSIYFVLNVISSIMSTKSITPWYFFSMQNMWKTEVHIAVLQMLAVAAIILGTCAYKCSRKAESL